MINCLIVDDEPHSAETLKSYVEKIDGLSLTGVFNHPLKAINFLEANKNTQIDIAFLDIEMPEMTGFELSEFLPAGTAIVYTTAHADYSLKAFETNVFDFLLKPVSF